MFGNKFSGDNIARDFLRALGEDFYKKEDSHPEELTKQAREEKPEDFLVLPEEEVNISMVLDQKINEFDDDTCESCKEALESCSCGDYTLDKKSEEVLAGLAKVSASLKSKNEDFAADVVNATAEKIKETAIKKAAKKAFVLKTLRKMSAKFEEEKEIEALGYVNKAINTIKNS